MKEKNDPRIKAIAKPATRDGEYRGFQNGPASLPEDNGLISRIGTMYREEAAGFTPFMKASEVSYIKAEAAMLGYNVGISAQEAYENAVRLSMEENGISTEEADAFLAGAGKWNNSLEQIYWDEWVSLFKNNFEAWCLYRRTGIPSTNYVSIKSIYGSAHTDQPFRLPYPNNEYQYNADNVKAAAANVVDYAWGEQMMWDTRTNVK